VRSPLLISLTHKMILTVSPFIVLTPLSLELQGIVEPEILAFAETVVLAIPILFLLILNATVLASLDMLELTAKCLNALE